LDGHSRTGRKIFATWISPGSVKSGTWQALVALHNLLTGIYQA
jgi:hypothetical protein